MQNLNGYLERLYKGLPEKPDEAILGLRDRLIDALLLIGTLAGFLPAIAVTGRMTLSSDDWANWSLLLVTGVFYLVMPVCFMFRKKLSFRVRSVLVLATVHCYAFYLVATFGIQNSGFWILIALSLVTTVLFGNRVGAISIACTFIVITTIAYNLAGGEIISLYKHHFLQIESTTMWVLVFSTFVLVVSIAISTSGIFQNYLVRTLGVVNERTGSLEAVNEELWVEVANRKRAEREREKMAQHLGQAQKLEALGRLAGFVAHDFNNILMAIRGYCEIVGNSIETGTKDRDDLDEISLAVDRAAVLTSQLLAFSRKQMTLAKIVNLNEFVSRSLKILSRLLGEDITIHLKLEDDLAPVKIDPNQFDHVLINLAVNARDAMPDGGNITLRTGRRKVEVGEQQGSFFIRPGEYILLTFEDDGCGMDATTMSKIFDPFFTTKGIGRGTGLGLAMVREIVMQNLGHIWVSSNPGEGTTFFILLPEAKTSETYISHAAAPLLPVGDETVLLIEDDKMVRNIVKRMTQQLGYRVLSAKNGEKALEVARTYQGPIHLILTDVVMPLMTGPELEEALVKLRPNVKTLYMSGYTDEIISNHGIEEGKTHLIEKPFTVDLLAQEIREVLGEPTGDE